MGYYGSNIYYSPEEFGLEIVFEVEEEPNYSFNKLVAWRQKDSGLLFWATDSGCSCPSPFEDHKLADLKPVTTPQELHDALDDMAYRDEYGYRKNPGDPWSRGDWGPTGKRTLASGWSEGEVAEGHRKISELRIPGFGGYAIPEAA